MHYENGAGDTGRADGAAGAVGGAGAAAAADGAAVHRCGAAAGGRHRGGGDIRGGAVAVGGGTGDKMIEIWEELNRFKGAHLDTEIRMIYDRFPETECLGCGRCCYDPPEITYTEFLYAFDYYIKQPHTKDDIVTLYKKIYYRYMYGPIQDLPCAFLDNENRCIIHPASPFNCKRWGLQSIEEYQRDLKYADRANDDCIAYFGIYGIEVYRKKYTEYCDHVKITKYNDRNIEKVISHSFEHIFSLDRDFSTVTRAAYDIHNFFLAAFFKENRLSNDRIRQLKKYQAGDSSAIDMFISSIDFEDKLELLLKRY